MWKIPTRHFLAAFWLGTGSFVGAAQWTGYVFNGETRAPMAGVLVRSNTGLDATTDDHGAYLIKDPTTALEPRPSVSWDPSRQTLEVQLDQRQALRLEVLDLSGRLLSRPYNGEAGPGVWRWSSSSMGRNLKPVVLRLVRGGKATTSWTILPGLGGLPPKANGKLSARVTATTPSDTFWISLPGFDSARVLAQAGSSTLDTAWLAPRVVLGAIPWNALITYGTLKDLRDNRTYRTVHLGAQNWMAQNLNFKPAGADSGICSFNKADSCTKYGRLYGWYTAMAGQLASPYLPRPATGICPSGWHLPSQAEWGELTKFVGPASKGVRDLKSTAGWTNYGSGSDAYGFRALPAGFDSRGSGVYGGQMAYWWTSSAAAQDSNAFSMFMEPSSYTISSTSQLSLGYSVRCLEGALVKPKDTILTSLVIFGGRGRSLAPAFHPDTLVYRDTVPWTIASVIVAAKTLDTTSASVWIQGIKTNNVSIPLGVNGTTTLIKVVVRSQDGDSLKYQISVYRPVVPPTFGIPWQTGITYGTLYDARDGNVYRTVGNWMAQNLNYKVAGADSGSCVSNSLDSCAKYGRLYQWSTVMNGADSSSSFPSGVQGICPGGWHIPSEQEWLDLEHSGFGGYTTSEELKSLAGWADATNGTDARGFRALPAGELNSNSWQKQGTEASWWSTTKLNVSDSTYPNLQVIKSTSVIPFSGATWATEGHSLRCVKN